jgi:replication factor C subunit 1
MPADIRSFFGGGPPKASQGSEGSAKKDEVCLPSRYN